MSISESEPLQMFLYAIKSPETKRKYVKRLDDFFNFLELTGTREDCAKQFVEKAHSNNNWAFANLLKYITFHKDRANRGEITEGTVANYYKPIKLFLEMNDIALSWKKISRGIPKGRKFASDRAPTLDEIRALCEYPDRRIKAIVYTMCSSGIRVGAWNYLKWKNIIPIEQDEKIVSAKIIVYDGDDEQYHSYITPETYGELKKWMDFRTANGELITGESWLMRDLWNIQKFSRGLVTVPKRLKAAGVKRLIERALHAQGIRKKLALGQRRHEFQADHGFRKFFKTQTEQIMKPINVEVLMGHSTGISDSYYRPNDAELLKDYLNAIPQLTISKEHRMINNAEKLRTHGSEIENLKEEIRRIKIRNEIEGALRHAIALWSEKNPDKLGPLQVAKADFSKSKGLDETIEHILQAHDGDASGLIEKLVNGKFTITD